MVLDRGRARAYPFTARKTCRDRRWPLRGCSPGEGARHVNCVQNPQSRARRTQQLACGDLIGANQAVLDQQPLQTPDPDFIVAQRAVLGQRLTRTAAGIEVPRASSTHRESKCQRLSFPGCMEQLTFRLRDHPIAYVLAAQVGVRSIIHLMSSSALANPVPIIESRVTNATSCSSAMVSECAGRRGITR